METTLMPQRHRNTPPWAWQLASCAAATLRAENVARWLRVESGLVWVTARYGGPDGADLWLEAGASLELPAGTAWVLQAWPQARLSLALQAPRTDCVTRGGGAWTRWGSRLAGRLVGARGGWATQPQ